MVAVMEAGTKDNSSQVESADILFGPLVRRFVSSDLWPALESSLRETATSMIDERLRTIPPQRIEILKNGALLTALPRQHYLFPAVMQLIGARDRTGKQLNLALVGPTGTGKTHMAIAASEAKKLDFVLQPFNPHTTKSELMGYMDANGRYVPSPFYRAFKDGKLFIADEFDTANPAVATVLNAAIANGVMTFPNGETLKAHTAFGAVIIMNTYGQGADDQYVGRSRLDRSTLDRLVFVEVPVDPGLEASLIGIPDVSSPSLDMAAGGRYATEREILQAVMRTRGAVESLKIHISVSPRATLFACALHDAGFGKNWIDNSCILRGLSDAQKLKVREHLGRGGR